MLTTDPAELRRAAEVLAEGVGRGSDVIAGESEVGGGSFPGAKLKTWLVQLTANRLTADDVAGRLRGGGPPVVARIQDDHGGPDPRTILPRPPALLVRAGRAALAGSGRVPGTGRP